MDCIFCKIVKKELPAEIIYESDKILAFKDLHPKAPFHVLVIPKRHIDSVKSLTEQDKDLIGDLILTAQKIAKKNNLSGYKIIFNVGKEGGQIINHLHLHLLAGKPIGLP